MRARIDKPDPHSKRGCTDDMATSIRSLACCRRWKCGEAVVPSHGIDDLMSSPSAPASDAETNAGIRTVPPYSQ